jgi:hypothetical protein
LKCDKESSYLRGFIIEMEHFYKIDIKEYSYKKRVIPQEQRR